MRFGKSQTNTEFARTFGRLPGVALMLILMAVLPIASVAVADEGSERLGAILAEKHPEVQVDRIRPAPVDGLYEVVSGVDVMYLTGDGRYLFDGALVDLFEQRNLTTEARASLAHGEVRKLASSMLVYDPPGEAQHTVTVFTDHTCPYCRHLHEDLLEMVAEDGVRLRYLMYPRQGLQSSAAETLRNIWCADDPHDAMTRAKRGESIDRRDRSCDPPLEEHFATGEKIGVSGTPYVLLNDDGPVFAGYRPREQLLEVLGTL